MNNQQQRQEETALKKQIVKKEIKRLNDLIKQFRQEDNNFQTRFVGQVDSSDKLLDSDFQSLNENIKSLKFGDEIKPHSNDNIFSSENSANKAFVQSDGEDEADEGHRADSPIFKNTVLNDTSFFKKEEMEFSPPPEDQKLGDPTWDGGLHGPKADQNNQTMDFDAVSFSKELAARGSELLERGDHMDEAMMMIKGDLPHNDQSNSMEKAHIAEGEPSFSHTNNNSFNFSNIFNQMNESNVINQSGIQPQIL